MIKHLVSNFDQHPLPDLPAPRILIPNKDAFEQFYNATMHYGEPSAVLTVQGDMALKVAWMQIEVSKHAILELIAEKYNQRIPVDSGTKIRSPPPFVEDIDEIIGKKMAQIHFDFGRTMEMHEKDTEKLVYDALQVYTYPLLARIEYSKWKESLIQYIVATAVSETELQKDKEIRTIRSEYEEKTKNDLAKTTLRINRLTEEVERYRTMAHGLQDVLDKNALDADNIRGEIESLHEKLSDAEDKASDFEAQLVEEKKKRKEAEDKLKKLEGESDWVADATCSPSKPVFLNRISSDVISLKCSIQDFKDRYTLKSSDGTMRIYEDEAGNVLEIPDALADKMLSLVNQESKKEEKPEEGKGKKEEKGGLTEDDHVVWDIIIESEEPLTAEEIATKSGKHINNVRNRHLYRLLKHGKIKEEIKDGKKVYYPVD